jgi:hypothetical protein
MYPAALLAQEGQSSHPEVEWATSCFQGARTWARSHEGDQAICLFRPSSSASIHFRSIILMTEASGSKPLATSVRNSSAV